MFWLPNPVEKRAQEAEERSRAYVDERLEHLRSELLALLESQSRGPGAGNDVALPLKKTLSELPANPLSAEHLDNQDKHEFEKSVWDCAMFVGLDCVGTGESIAVVLLLLLNCVMQVYFCIIVYRSPMMKDPLGDDVLDELLHFRTSVAHSVEHANLVSGRSLLSQVCNGEERLHVSGTQLRMYEDLTAFQGTGLLLVILAMVCWSTGILAELNSTFRLGLAVWQKRGKTTRITLQPEGGLLVESLCSLDVAKVFLLSIIPRALIACLLYSVGVLYLGRTSRLEDLLLNAMALAFILDVDELMYAAFVPHRVKSLIQGLAPLLLTPLSSYRQKRFRRLNRIFGGALDTLLRLLVLVVALVSLYYTCLQPFQGRVKQARDILCSGDRDFVYSLDPASGMVVAARTAKPEDSWAPAECAALRLARPALRREFGWSPPGGDCNESYLLRPSNISLKEWNAGAEFTRVDFEYVSSLTKSNVEQTAKHATCVDADSDAYLAALEDAVGSLVVVGEGSRLQCKDVRALCHLMNMTRVRALCPKTCECDLWGFSAAGLFKTPYFGCPDSCIAQAAAAEKRWRVNGTYPLECVDFTKTRYFFPPVIEPKAADKLQVMDIDEDGNVTLDEMTLALLRAIVKEDFWAVAFTFDLDDNRVWDASEQASLARAYDYIEAFDSNGDSSLSQAEVQAMADPIAFASVYDDANSDGLVSVAEMAGRGQVDVPPQPDRIALKADEGSLFFLEGVKEYVRNQPNFLRNLESLVQVLGGHLGLTPEQRRQMFEYHSTGGWVEDAYWGRWFLAPGVPHPQGLVWCGFIASWELSLLMGMDPCKHDLVASARTFCPQSCSCQAQMTDCPSSCPSIHKIGSALL